MVLNGVFSIKINGSIIYINNSSDTNKNSSKECEDIEAKKDNHK